MIIFITDSTIAKVTETTTLKVLHPKDGLALFRENLATIKINRVLVDTETTGLDPYVHKVLLLIIGLENGYEFVVDTTTEKGKRVAKLMLHEVKQKQSVVIGSNLKFDYKMIAIGFDFYLENTYDTEITERRLFQGLGLTNENPRGYRFGLLDTLVRRFKIAPPAMNKDVRKEFVGAKPDTFVFYNYHIKYAAGDVSELGKLQDAQMTDIVRNKQEFLIFGIEQPLMPVLAKAELKGFRLNIDKWYELYVDNLMKAHEYALKLDEEMRRLVAESPLEIQQFFRGGKLYKTRQAPFQIEKVGLFGEVLGNKEILKIAKKKINFNPNCINYESPDQLVILFGLLKEVYPTKSGAYVVPKIKGYQTITNKYEEFSGIEGNFNSYILDNPDSKMLPFIKLLIEFRFHSTRASNFGLNFIEKFLNPVTNRLHTALRQCNAVTGRLQSGDTDNGYYNAQNIPADKEYRHCFLADEGYSIGTYDLSGAEAVIMGSKAQDTELIRMAIIEDDIHSPLAQATWRNIYLYRAGQILNYWNDAKDFWKLKDTPSIIRGIKDYFESAELYEKAMSFSITKTFNKSLRTDFKPCTFGVVYGMYAKKAAKALNVTLQEGQIVIDTIKRMIPKTISMVEANSKFAVRNAFIVLNTRTNSRVWFPDVLRSIQYAVPLGNRERYSAESNARNYPIQGTQADMMKETMVEISKFIMKNNFDVHLLKQVHDELVYMIPKHMDGHSEEFLANPDNFNMDAYIKTTMKEVANRYLTNIKMGVEGEVKPYWTK